MKTMNFKGEKNDNTEPKMQSESNPLQIDDSTLDEISESINRIDFETPEKLAQKKVEQIKEAKEERTPKTNKKTTNALKSEEKEKLLGVTRSFVNGINEVLVDRLGEHWHHEKEEVDTYSVLVFAVLEKHFPDLSDMEYAEELALGMYMFGQEPPRILNEIEQRKSKNNE
jgi:hypothetical protein